MIATRSSRYVFPSSPARRKNLLTPSLVLQGLPDPQVSSQCFHLARKDRHRLWALLFYTCGYDRRIFPSERQRIDIAGCYLLLAYTGARPSEIVDGEKNIPTDGCWDELFGNQA